MIKNLVIVFAFVALGFVAYRTVPGFVKAQGPQAPAKTCGCGGQKAACGNSNCACKSGGTCNCGNK